ncbi:MAG: hypothetical protein Q7R79_03880 [bacterium]|nr:hypothetical protein [bacterium]
MNLVKLSTTARKFHKLLVLFIAALGIIMVATGTAMKFPALFPWLDPIWARQIHSLTSTYFALVFVLMMLTGLIMYCVPYLLKLSRGKP